MIITNGRPRPLPKGSDMKITNDALLNEFRRAGKCEWCGRYCYRREPHHVWAKGHGGGGRLDVRINLVALGSAGQCACHRMYHDGHILRTDLLAVVAMREQALQPDIEAVVFFLRRLPKDYSRGEVAEELAAMSLSERRLAARMLEL